MTGLSGLDCLLTGTGEPLYVVVVSGIAHPLKNRRDDGRIVCTALDAVTDCKRRLVLPGSFRNGGFCCPGEKLVVRAYEIPSGRTDEEIFCFGASPFIPRHEEIVPAYRCSQGFVVLERCIHSQLTIRGEAVQLPVLHVAQLGQSGRVCDVWIRMSYFQSNFGIINMLSQGDMLFEGTPSDEIVSTTPALGRPYSVELPTSVKATVRRVFTQNWGGCYNGYGLALAVDGDEKQPQTAPFWRVVYLRDRNLGSKLQPGTRVEGIVIPEMSPVSPFNVIAGDPSETITNFPYVRTSTITDLSVIGSSDVRHTFRNRMQNFLWKYFN